MASRVTGRARGLVPEPPPRLTLGSASLDAALAGPAPATRAVLAVVVAVSGAALLLPEDDLLLRLAKDNDAIRRGEVWRLLTAGLVHGGAVHLLLNASVLANVGRIVERLLGGPRMLAVLWGGVLTGSLASFATNPHPSVGISGGLFALVGALLVVGLRHRRALPPPARRMLVRAPIEIIVLNIALGLALPIIDNSAHLGGLAGGVLLGARARGSRPARDSAAALRERTGPSHRSRLGAGYLAPRFARSTRSQSSRTAPRPPGERATRWTASFTSGSASAGQAASPTRRRSGTSFTSSPMYATSSSGTPRCASLA